MYHARYRIKIISIYMFNAFSGALNIHLFNGSYFPCSN